MVNLTVTQSKTKYFLKLLSLECKISLAHIFHIHLLFAPLRTFSLTPDQIAFSKLWSGPKNCIKLWQFIFK